MCPFLDEEDDDEDINYDSYSNLVEEEPKSQTKYSVFKDDRKFFAIGSIASVIAFCSIAYFLYSNSKPVDLDDLPVIRADTTPIKVKPLNNVQVEHQDKIVYDNISGEQRKKEEEHVLAQPEEVLSINEVDSGGVLSEEEKQKIINAFDELAPEKEYKIEYIRSSEKGNKVSSPASKFADTKQQIVKIVESDDVDALPPIKRIEEVSSKNISKKKKLTDFVETDVENPRDNIKENIMVQIASLPTKNGAEVEYRRLANRSRFIKKYGKKIYKVDLGKSKGNTYRLQIGPFRSNAEAQRVISALRNNGCYAYISK